MNILIDVLKDDTLVSVEKILVDVLGNVKRILVVLVCKQRKKEDNNQGRKGDYDDVEIKRKRNKKDDINDVIVEKLKVNKEVFNINKIVEIS